MGELDVRLATNQRDTQRFVKHLLKDLKALEIMLAKDLFERDIVRIGAEQELCLIDRHSKPAPLNMEVLASANHPLLTSELAKFNLEYNLDPLPFRGDCLSAMERQIAELLEVVREHAAKFDTEPIMTGILPTIRKVDVAMDNMTPLDRYRALLTALDNLREDTIELKIRGIDELRIKHDSPLLEGCNTGFQVHLQVHPDEFAEKYNIAQLLTAPVLAVSANSPLLFGKRLWYETRIALFQQSIDTRTIGEHLRFQSPRVMFGHRWLDRSITEIYKEDVARFRVLLSADLEEDALVTLQEGRIPKLKALQIHNGTVYRWNRPCYGISDTGKPHLRIENRVLPAGPSIVDEMASSALWLGAMVGFHEQYGDIRNLIHFEEVGHNFLGAARMGLTSKFNWFNHRKIDASELILKEIAPIAREGLAAMKIDSADIDRYIGIVEERARRNTTGAQWMLNSYMGLIKTSNPEEVLSTITSSIVRKQTEGSPVHEWALAEFEDSELWQPDTLLVEEFMTTDVYTCHKEDLLELVAEMMDWNKIRYMPVENDQGDLEGLITARILLRYFSGRHLEGSRKKPIEVKSVMLTDPITVGPEQSIVDVINIMYDRKIGCLPVVKGRKLVGIVTEGNFMGLIGSLIKRYARKKKKES